MKKIILSAMLCSLTVLGIDAQTTKEIKGAVIDKHGNPLPGALVESTGGAESAIVDADGTFSLEIPIWLKSVTARYAGMRDKKRSVKPGKEMIFVMKPETGYWFLNLEGSYVRENGTGVSAGRIGLMGGYLGKWGGYAKLMPILGVYSSSAPSFVLGAIKQMTKSSYFHLGLGFAPVISDRYIYTTSRYDYYSGSYTDEYIYHTDWWPGMMVDAGFIFKTKKRFCYNFGYALSTDFDGSLNHDITVGVGYAF